MRLLPLIALCACGAAAPATDCSATVDDAVRTRVHVAWSAPDGGESWVELRPEGREALIAAAPEGSGERHAVVVGAGPLEDVEWAAITEIDGRRFTCSGQLATGNTPSGLPSFEVTTYDAERASPERFVLGAVQAQDALVFLIDREARLVWWHAVPGRAVIDVEATGGADLAWNAFDAELTADVGQLQFASVLGGDVTTLDTTRAHHTFARTPDGYAWLALDARDWTDPATGEVVKVAGDKIVVGAPGVAPRDVWSTWDTFVVEPTPEWDDSEFYAGYKDWTHGNGLSYDADRDAFLYSSARLGTVVQVDAGSGEVVESYGRMGELHFGGAFGFIGQHDPTFTPDGALLVSNRTPDTEVTAAMEFDIERAGGQIVKRWDSGTDHGIRASWLGQAQRLPNGNTLVGFGSAGVVQEVTPEGDVVWELRLGLGAAIGMISLVADPQEMAPSW